MDASFRCRSSGGIAAAAYEDSQLGCVGSILHFLHLHHRFHHHRKLLDAAARRHKKQHTRADDATGVKYSKLKRLPTAQEEYELMTASATDDHMMEEFDPRTTTTTAAPSKEKDKKKKEKKKKKKSPAPKQLNRTLSIHYLECDDYVVPEEKTPSTRDDTSSSCDTHEATSGTESVGSSNRVKPFGSRLSEEQVHQEDEFAPQHHSPGSRECLAVKPSSSALQDPMSASRHHMADLQMHSTDPMLSRSGSYPAFRNSVRTRLGRTVSMDTPVHVHNETETGYGNRSSSIATKDAMNLSERDVSTFIADRQHTLFRSASGNLQEIKQEREDKNHSKALQHFKNIKNRIKDIIKEEKKEGRRISMDGVLHKVPYGQKPPSDLDADGGSITEKVGLRNSLWHDNAAAAGNRPQGPPQIRRSRSLSDSLERYSYLLESISRESKEDMGERPRPSIVDTAFFVMNRSKTLGRIYSLRESEPNSSRNDDVSVLLHDISVPRRSINLDSQETTTVSEVGASMEQCSSKTQMNSETDHLVEEETSQQDIENSDNPNEVQLQPAHDSASDNVVDRGESGRSPSETGKHNVHDDEMMAARENDSNKPIKAIPISVLDRYSDEDFIGPVKFTATEVRRITEVEIPTIAESADDETCSGSSIELPFLKESGPEVHHILEASKNEAEFNYVLNILRKSGFSDKEFLGKWYSPEQPINPSLYVDEIMNPETDASECDADTDLYHLLLFDLMNEVLLEISTGSSSYDPWMPCISSHIRSIPFEYNLLPKVWQRISWHINCTQRQNIKLDPVGWAGWMNLKYDMENIGLELDKMILDELLDEMIFGDLLEEAIAKGHYFSVS